MNDLRIYLFFLLCLNVNREDLSYLLLGINMSTATALRGPRRWRPGQVAAYLASVGGHGLRPSNNLRLQLAGVQTLEPILSSFLNRHPNRGAREAPSKTPRLSPPAAATIAVFHRHAPALYALYLRQLTTTWACFWVWHSYRFEGLRAGIDLEAWFHDGALKSTRWCLAHPNVVVLLRQVIMATFDYGWQVEGHLASRQIFLFRQCGERIRENKDHMQFQHHRTIYHNIPNLQKHEGK